MPKKKSDSHMGAWLMVDEKNKKVEYQVDSAWFKNSSDEEQDMIFERLARVANAYRNAGYAIINFVKRRL